MNEQLLAFAASTPNAHIAIVEADNLHMQWQWTEVQRQFSREGFSVPVWGKFHLVQYLLRLNNDTVIVLFTSEQYEQMLGWQFDRIETTSAALALMPEWFCHRRLKPGIDPAIGISLRDTNEVSS